MTVRTQVGVLAFQEILLNERVYLAMSINGQGLLPKGKWIAEPVSSQQSGTTDLTGGNPTAALVALEKQGITVRELGTKVIGGVNSTGYTVTPPGGQATITVWIDPRQHLVREISENATFNVLSGGASASPAPASTANAAAVDLTMDFAYSAAPLRVTAPPAASTVSFAAFLQQLGQNPALKQLEPTSAS